MSHVLELREHRSAHAARLFEPNFVHNRDAPKTARCPRGDPAGCQLRASSKADAWREPVVASATGRRVAIGAGAHERGHPPLSLLLGERLQDRWSESARRWRVCACLL